MTRRLPASSPSFCLLPVLSHVGLTFNCSWLVFVGSSASAFLVSLKSPSVAVSIGGLATTASLVRRMLHSLVTLVLCRGANFGLMSSSSFLAGLEANCFLVCCLGWLSSVFAALEASCVSLGCCIVFLGPSGLLGTLEIGGFPLCALLAAFSMAAVAWLCFSSLWLGNVVTRCVLVFFWSLCCFSLLVLCLVLSFSCSSNCCLAPGGCCMR